MLPRRILIYGAPGSGKNFLAERLSRRTGIRVYDLDDILFRRKFDLLRPRSVRRKRLAAITRRTSWIVGGVPYSWSQFAVAKAQRIVILRQSFAREAFRIVRRHIHRRFAGPKETLRDLRLLLKYNYGEYHAPRGEKTRFLHRLQRVYKKKVTVLASKRDVAQFLESFV